MNEDNKNNVEKKFSDRPDVQAIKKDVKTIKDGATSLASHTKSGAVSMAQDGRDYLREEGAKDIHKLEDYISSHPAKSVGLALLGGIVFSKLFGRRK